MDDVSVHFDGDHDSGRLQKESSNTATAATTTAASGADRISEQPTRRDD